MSRMALDRTDCRTGSEAPDLVGARIAGGHHGVEALLRERSAQRGGGGVFPQVVHLQGILFKVVQYAVAEAVVVHQLVAAVAAPRRTAPIGSAPWFPRTPPRPRTLRRSALPSCRISS